MDRTPVCAIGSPLGLHGPHDRDRVAQAGHRPVARHLVPVLVELADAGAEPEPEPAPRQLVEVGRRQGGEHRAAGEGERDPGAHPDPGRARRDRRGRHRRAAVQLGRPGDPRARGLGGAGRVHQLGEALAPRLHVKAHHDATGPWPRR
nr:hypothetical protein GCM10020092_036110 [Actinoplanes digitatis]